jgi:hypothetical protein
LIVSLKAIEYGNMVEYSMKQDGDNHLVHDSAASKDDDAMTPEEIAYRDEVIPLLLVRAYHLPHNTWYQDWVQYMTNNHPVLGIFWHHRYHPVKRIVRIASLIGSMLFGLALTNIIYLAFVFSKTDYDKSYVEVHPTTATTGNMIVDSAVPALSVTNGNIALWTIGSFLNAAYDNLIWSFAACSCCDKGVVTEQKLTRYRSLSVFLVMLSVVVVTALATFAVALRAALSSDDGTQLVDSQTDDTGEAFVTKNAQLKSYGVSDDNVQLFQVDGANDFEFMIAYFIELVLNYFIYYPIVGTLLFSGVLTRGRWGVWGGRPFELKEEEEKERADDMEQACRSSHKSPRD